MGLEANWGGNARTIAVHDRNKTIEYNNYKSKISAINNKPANKHRLERKAKDIYKFQREVQRVLQPETVADLQEIRSDLPLHKFKSDVTKVKHVGRLLNNS